jgi:hypothetical protein
LAAPAQRAVACETVAHLDHDVDPRVATLADQPLDTPAVRPDAVQVESVRRLLEAHPADQSSTLAKLDKHLAAPTARGSVVTTIRRLAPTRADRPLSRDSSKDSSSQGTAAQSARLSPAP